MNYEDALDAYNDINRPGNVAILRAYEEQRAERKHQQESQFNYPLILQVIDWVNPLRSNVAWPQIELCTVDGKLVAVKYGRCMWHQREAR